VTERVLTARELNRALLARQLLFERSPLPLTRSLERVAGLQTQYAPSGYVSLWSRLRDFHREALTRALEQRRAVQTTLMRLTIHTVSTRDFPVFAAGIRRGRRDWWLGQYRKQLEGVDMQAVASRVREHLAKGPRRASDLKELLRSEGLPSVAWSGLGLWLDMVRVPLLEPGSNDGPTCTAWPRTGSGPRPRRKQKDWSTSYAGTWVGSVPRR